MLECVEQGQVCAPGMTADDPVFNIVIVADGFKIGYTRFDVVRGAGSERPHPRCSKRKLKRNNQISLVKGESRVSKKTFITGVLALLCCVSSVHAQKRGPSTPEERKKAVEMVNFLETNPFAKEAKEIRGALLHFLTEVPDISIKLCTSVFGEPKKFKGDYEAELLGQTAYSQAKFIIEHPDKAQDEAAVQLAGVEGVLRTWQAIKAAKPKAKFPLLDELLAKQQSLTLAEHVKENLPDCTKK